MPESARNLQSFRGNREKVSTPAPLSNKGLARGFQIRPRRMQTAPIRGRQEEENVRMATRVNRAIELLQQGQAIYYDGAHSGHVLTYEQGRRDAGTWADYMNVGMEHGCFDMTGLAEYMRGMVEA